MNRDRKIAMKYKRKKDYCKKIILCYLFNQAEDLSNK